MGCNNVVDENCPQQPFGPLMLNKMPNKPWENISMDLIA